MLKFQLPTPTTCPHCHARLFYHESSEQIFPRVRPPHELLQIFSSQTFESRNFREHIRSYNHVFSFSSLVVHMD